MKYREWFKQKDRYIFLIDISPPDGEYYSVCYGWFIVKPSSLLKFQDSFGIPDDWVEDAEPTEYFSELKLEHKRKMIQDLFERVIK